MHAVLKTCHKQLQVHNLVQKSKCQIKWCNSENPYLEYFVLISIVYYFFFHQIIWVLFITSFHPSYSPLVHITFCCWDQIPGPRVTYRRQSSLFLSCQEGCGSRKLRGHILKCKHKVGRVKWKWGETINYQSPPWGAFLPAKLHSLKVPLIDDQVFTPLSSWEAFLIHHPHNLPLFCLWGSLF